MQSRFAIQQKLAKSRGPLMGQPAFLLPLSGPSLPEENYPALLSALILQRMPSFQSAYSSPPQHPWTLAAQSAQNDSPAEISSKPRLLPVPTSEALAHAQRYRLLLPHHSCCAFLMPLLAQHQRLHALEQLLSIVPLDQWWCLQGVCYQLSKQTTPAVLTIPGWLCRQDLHEAMQSP